MRLFLRRLLKSVAYVAAALVILLAVGVGLFRLMLPRLPEYQDELKEWARAAIGLDVEFSGMDARWRLSGPELNFYNASLRVPDAEGGVFAADEVTVGVGLMRLLIDRTLVVDRIGVRDSVVDLRRGSDGAWLVQGMRLKDLKKRFSASPRAAGDLTVVGEELTLNYRHSNDAAALTFDIDAVTLTVSGQHRDAEAVVSLPASLGSRMLVTAGERPGHRGDQSIWHLTVESRGLILAGWSRLQPAWWPDVTAGNADLSLVLDWREDRVTNATANMSLLNVTTAASGAAFAADGRIDYERNAEGWLLVADDVRLQTSAGVWPQSDIRVEAGTGQDGELKSLAATAGYLNLADLDLMLPWLPEAWQSEAQRYAPSGYLRDLTLSVDDLRSDEPHYDVAMQLEDAGLRAGERWPGVRGFTGSLRANRSGGRLEVDANDLVVDLPRWLAEPVPLQRAQGTVIWRRNPDGIIVLSDSIALANEDMASRSSLQISVPSGDGTPVVDLESRWSIADVGSARRYLPVNLIKPALYRWLNTALVAGRVPQGTTRFSGPLDKFPFDDNEGVFLVQATLEDATLRYSELWPDVENLDLDLIVDRTRIYSDSNTALNAGNNVVDAEIEIADLREPILTIDAVATGTMETIRQFARRSPIANVFGGHLDRVAVDGDASFNLNLTYPIADRDNYEFTTRIEPDGAMLRVDGFAPPISELHGIVTISRRDIDTESLSGRLLGEPVTIGLRPGGDAAPSYSVIATLKGQVTAEGIEAGFGIPVQGIVDGSSAFEARLSFPRADAADPRPFLIEVESDMTGTAVALPSPAGKGASPARPLSLTIEFPRPAAIETRGSFGDGLSWTLNFLRDASGWDFDRGTLAVGGGAPATADTRGLHIVGLTPELRLRDWLSLASGEASGVRLADRIRSMDLTVQDLYILGQHFGEHRVVVDRSANDWAVRLEGEQALGNVTIPYDFQSGRPLIVDMQRLLLPGSDEGGDETAVATDPRTIPPLSVRVDEFALGSRHLGRIEAALARTPDGLRADNITTVDESFAITGSAGWVVDTNEPTGQRTFVTAVLKSSDVEATMRRLNSQPGIDSEDMEIRFDVSWSGAPREDFLSSLNGDFVVRFGTGQLEEVEPGASRMFGLMSVVALPRRLSLDFRDVIDKGFVFDEITGTFRVRNGDAYTCDLSLTGPGADIGIVGRAGLVAEDYEQTAIVSANVGNTLPFVGGLVAGPQVAAALLIFSQIFKKPLEEMGQVYYAIEGTWDEPEVESSNARRFAASSKLAGCIAEGE